MIATLFLIAAVFPFGWPMIKPPPSPYSHAYYKGPVKIIMQDNATLATTCGKPATPDLGGCVPAVPVPPATCTLFIDQQYATTYAPQIAWHLQGICNGWSGP